MWIWEWCHIKISWWFWLEMLDVPAAMSPEQEPPVLTSYLIIVDQLFLHHLHCIHLLILLQTHQQNFGVAASSDHPNQFKVGQTQNQSLWQLNATDAVHHCTDVLQQSNRMDECVQRGHSLVFWSDLLTSESSVLASIRSCGKKTEKSAEIVYFLILPVGGAAVYTMAVKGCGHRPWT